MGHEAESNAPRTSHTRATSPDRPLRVLHWLGGLGGGGVENWMLQLIRELDPEQFQVDVMALRPDGDRSEDVRREAHRLIECRISNARPVQFLRRARSRMLEFGPYDVFHCHIGISNGLACVAAHQAGIPVRIAHSRGASADFRSYNPVRWAYLQFARWAMRRHATHLLAISSDAAQGLFGPTIETHPKYRRIVTSIDLEPFRAPVDGAKLRERWGIPADAKVIGHVARFQEYKNHPFIVEMARELSGSSLRTHFLLVGDGSERAEIERQVAEHGLRDSFTFTGFQDNVPELMQAMDLFVFPSKWEGLGRVIVEAQAAGMPCVISDAVPPVATVVDEIVHRLPLSAGPAKWAGTAEAVLGAAPVIDQATAFARVEASEFNMAQSARVIADIYRQGCSAANC